MRRLRGWIEDSNPDFLINLVKGQAGQDLFVIAMTQGRRNGTWLELGAWRPLDGSNTYLLETRYQWSGISVDIDDHSVGMISQFEKIWADARQPSWPQKILSIIDLDQEQQHQIQQQYLDVWITETLNYIDHIPQASRCWSTVRPRTQFLQCDALMLDINSLPGYFDYLQIDIDPVGANIEMLHRLIPKLDFALITFEHDWYRGSVDVIQAREISRAWLEQHGYVRIAGDVAIESYLMDDQSLAPFVFEDWWANPRYIEQRIIQQYQCLQNGPKYWIDILLEEYHES